MLNWVLARSILTNLTWSLDPSHCLHFSALSFQLFHLPHLSIFYPLQSHTFSSRRLTRAFSRPLSLTAPVLFLCVQNPFLSLTRIFKRLPHLTSSPSLCLSSPVILPSPNHPPASLFSALSPSPHPACPSPPLTLPNPCAPASRQLITEPAPDELSFVVKFLIIALGLQVFRRCPPLLSLTPLSFSFSSSLYLNPPPLPPHPLTRRR